MIHGYRDTGLVNEVFTPEVLASVSRPNAHMATGHVRYATAGSRSRANAQPMIVRHGRGTMALCHNGNLVNASQLRTELENEGAIFHSTSDTEVICYLITRFRLQTASIEDAISRTMERLDGAYSLVIMSSTKLIAARDPRGYRPLCIGTLPGGGYVFASESCALDAAGATLLRDVEPGEIVVADASGLRSIRTHCGAQDQQMCVFEFIYFARPDSVVEGSSVHEARKQAGRFLALEHPVEADVVIGVPDSGLWCWWTTPSSGAPPPPGSSACCGMPGPRRSTSWSPPLRSSTPATSAPTSRTRRCWWPPAAMWTRSMRSSGPTPWAICPSTM